MGKCIIDNDRNLASRVPVSKSSRYYFDDGKRRSYGSRTSKGLTKILRTAVTGHLELISQTRVKVGVGVSTQSTLQAVWLLVPLSIGRL